MSAKTDAPVPVVVVFLLSVTGPRLSSMVLDLKDPQALLALANGEREASPEEACRIRAAHLVVQALCDGGLPPQGVQSWLCGMNPDLDDECPAELLQTGDPAKAERVLHAARAHGL